MTGPIIGPFGDVTSSALQGLSEYADASAGFYQDSYLVEGQIEKVYAKDDSQNDENNRPGSVTLYDVLTRTPDGSTTVLRRCRMLQPMFGGGINNFMEVLPSNPGPKAKLPINSALKPGSKVLVGLISGQRSSPVIVGALPHENPIATLARPVKADGVQLQGEFQGLNWEINNDGELIIKFQGPKNDLGALINSNQLPTEIKINKTGDFSVKTHTTKDDDTQSVEMDSTNKKMTIKVGTKITWEMDSETGKVTLVCDDVQIDTTKDTQINTEGKTEINAKKDVIVNSATGIKLQKGDSAPTEPFVLGKEFVQMMQKLLQGLVSHQHIGNLGAPAPLLDPSPFSSLLSSPIGDKKILSKHILGVK